MNAFQDRARAIRDYLNGLHQRSLAGRRWNDFAKAAVLYFRNTDVQRPSAIGLTMFVQLFAAWLFIHDFRPIAKAPSSSESFVTIFGRSAAQAIPLEPDLQTPNVLLPAIPDIEIAASDQQEQNRPLAAAAGSQILAPRPDPNHINAFPDFPAGAAKVAAGIQLILKILVERDGTVSEVEVTKSSGDAKLDEFAVAFVKTHWRYLPALAGAIAVPDWTTVLVPLRH